MASGRELFGFPKKIAEVEMKSNGPETSINVGRQGQQLISCTFYEGNKLVSLPLPLT